MVKLLVKKELDVSAEKVWNSLKRFTAFNEYSPTIESVILLSENEIGEGAQRQCSLYNGMDTVETVTNWIEGESYTITVEPQGKSLPVKNMVSTLKVVPLDSNRAEFTWLTTYNVKFGMFGKLLNKIIISRFFRKGVTNNIIAIEEHVRTGRIIGNNDLKVTSISSVPS